MLSDTNDPDIWLDEARAWASVRRTLRGRSGFYYRRRPKNVGRKSGNIHYFCQKWGYRYRYMVVLDADSLLTGETLVAMVEEMEQD